VSYRSPVRNREVCFRFRCWQHARPRCDRQMLEVQLVAGAGLIDVSERVNISGEGSLIGDVIAQRVSFAKGTFFKGVINIHMPGPGNHGMVAPGSRSCDPRGLHSRAWPITQTAKQPRPPSTATPSRRRSGAPIARRWKYRTEIENIGRIVCVAIRFAE
jgi:hypothetical protein